MKTSDQPSPFPRSPEVVGFEMPGADAGPDSGAGKVMMVMLDTVPSRRWASTFAKLAATFKAEQQLDEIRLIGRNLSLIGPADRLRRLAVDAKALVYRVSRQTLQQQVTSLEGHDGNDEDAALARPAPDPERLRDVAQIAAIGGVHALLEAVTRATGMRFAAVARVTDQRWTACAVYDLIEFGLLPGQDLVLESTICNEIRQHGRVVTIDRASTDPNYSCHPTPALYGFESYISVPIARADGSFFGTLCALDPEPARLDEATTQTLQMFARMLGLQLAAESPSPLRDS